VISHAVNREHLGDHMDSSRPTGRKLMANYIFVGFVIGLNGSECFTWRSLMQMTSHSICRHRSTCDKYVVSSLSMVKAYVHVHAIEWI
jgi:hypothetical protein